jgi:hypothetical protein
MGQCVRKQSPYTGLRKRKTTIALLKSSVNVIGMYSDITETRRPKRLCPEREPRASLGGNVPHKYREETVPFINASAPGAFHEQNITRFLVAATASELIP